MGSFVYSEQGTLRNNIGNDLGFCPVRLALGAEDDEVKDQPHCHLQDERHQRPKYPADRKVKIDHLDQDLSSGWDLLCGVWGLSGVQEMITNPKTERAWSLI